MINSRFPVARIPVITIGFAMLFVIASGCRTSHEARRTSSARNAYGARGGAPAMSAQEDSLLMIQEKLVEVIDSMTTLVSADHARIRALEQEVRAIESQSGVGAGGIGAALPPEPLPDPTGAVTPPPADPPPASVATPSSYSDEYADALRRFSARDYSGALQAFQSLEVNDPNGALAGNYRYWQGECYFGEGAYTRALRTFESMRNEYPNSPKSSAASFMRGQCYEHLGDNAQARAAYEGVIANYPNTNYSERARARLKTLE